MTKPKLNTLVIGCGNIASKFDQARDSKQPPLTHIGAYKKHGGFNIVGCIDTDEKEIRESSRYWGISGFSDIHEAFEKNREIDIVSICATTTSHTKIINDIFKFNVKAIFCEKPIS